MIFKTFVIRAKLSWGQPLSRPNVRMNLVPSEMIRIIRVWSDGAPRCELSNSKSNLRVLEWPSSISPLTCVLLALDNITLLRSMHVDLNPLRHITVVVSNYSIFAVVPLLICLKCNLTWIVRAALQTLPAVRCLVLNRAITFFLKKKPLASPKWRWLNEVIWGTFNYQHNWMFLSWCRESSDGWFQPVCVDKTP